MGEFYADIIVDISHEKLDKTFQYSVPDRLKGVLETGMCVEVPFGNGNKMVKGYCVGLGNVCKFDPARMKEIRDIVKGGVVAPAVEAVVCHQLYAAQGVEYGYGNTVSSAYIPQAECGSQ